MTLRLFGPITGLLAIMALVGCSQSGPSGVVESHIEAISEGNVEGVKETLPPSMGESLGEKLAMLVLEQSRRAARKGGVKEVEILSEEVVGNTGTVSFTVHFNDGSSRNGSSSIIKIDGQWYVSDPESAGRGMF